MGGSAPSRNGFLPHYREQARVGAADRSEGLAANSSCLTVVNKNVKLLAIKLRKIITCRPRTVMIMNVKKQTSKQAH
jgi:hypothetical protein